MSATLATFLTYLLLYKYVALFAIVFSIAVVVPLPANIFLLAAGAFASLGYLNFPIAIAVALVANVSGDTLDFLLARHFGPRVLKFFRMDERPRMIRLQNHLRNHEKFTIFISRFVGPLDLIVSLSSGIARVPVATFIAYDFLGNACSNVIILSIGYIAGVSWQNVSGTVDITSTILLGVVTIFIIARYFMRNKDPLEEKVLLVE